jgi:hypothetical protein
MDKKYTEDEIKKAFWSVFHEAGEAWFNYLGTEKDNNSSTESYWNDLKEELEKNG